MKPNYKKTPVGIIPEDWEVKKVGEIGDPKMCKRIFKAETSEVQNEDYAIPFFKIGTFGREPDAFISEKLFLDYKKKYSYPKVGDILISAAGTIGRLVVFNGDPAYYQDSNIVWIENDEELITNRFLFFQYSQIRWIKTEGGIVSRLYNNDLKRIKLPIPPLPEQKAIADCLSTWDKAIEKQTQLIKAKKEFKKGLMQGFFNGQLTVVNEQGTMNNEQLEEARAEATRSPENKATRPSTLREPQGSGKTNRGLRYSKPDLTIIKAKEGEDFTKDWEEVRLGDVAKINYGTRIVKSRTEPGEYFVYGGGGRTFTTKDFNRKDCLIVARFAMSEECARFVKGKFFLNDSGLTIESSDSHSQLFLDYLILFFQHRIYKLRAGGAQQNLDVSALKKLKIKLPLVKLQTTIAQVLQSADKEIEILEQQLEQLQLQKKGLMQTLLTGEKRLV